MSVALKRALLDEYGGFSDKRIKRLETGKRFTIDDRSPRDEGADGHLYSYFCMVFATVVGDDELEISLHGNVPTSPSVKAWFAKHGELRDGGGEFSMKPQDAAILRELARAMRSITAPGKKYSTKSYKHVVPRTAKALERLATVLDKYARSNRT